MSTPRKSSSRRPCTPESAQGRSPRAPGPPRSPDRHIGTPDRSSKSYLRPTVSSTLHHGISNTHQPRKSIDKPPFLPPSSVGVKSQHHKNSSSSGKSSLSLKGILTRATNAMKVGSDKHRKTSRTSAGVINIGSGTSTPVRPRSPAYLQKKMEARKSFARSNSVPKKIGAGKKSKERDTMSICSIDDTLPEHLPDPVEINNPHAPHAEPHVDPRYNETIEDNFLHVEVMENFITAAEGNLIEENHQEIKLEETQESPKVVDNDKAIEQCQEEAMDTPSVDTEIVVIGDRQEEVAPEIEPVNVVEEFSQKTENVVIIVNEQEEKKHEEEVVTESPKEAEEIVVVVDSAEEEEEETKQEEPKESEEEVIAENHEAPKEEVEEEKPAVEPETKVEDISIIAEEINVTSVATPKVEENGTIEDDTPKVEDKLIPIQTEEKEEEVVVETPKVEEKPASTVVSEAKKERAGIRKADAVATRREGGISNDMIEETKSKLMEKRKNKVLALVGAFETVMQKPDEASTRR